MDNAIRLVIGLALAWALAPAAAQAQTFQMLSIFPSGSDSDPAPGGAVPVAGLIKVGKYLYGTAASGANIFHEPPWGCGFSNGCGSIFSVNAATGKLTTLYKFCSLANCADGGHPLAGLVYRDGAFYGTTETGGNVTAGSGAGTVYKLARDGSGAWVETVLYDFCSTKIYCRDGNNPSARLVFDSAGMLYGTTAGGPPEGGYGTVFKLDPATGVLTTLHRFTGGTDGSTPVPGLVFGKGGDLYGTTEYGGDSGNGTVFRLKPATGKLATILAFPTAYHDGNPYWPFGTNPVMWSKPTRISGLRNVTLDLHRRHLLTTAFQGLFLGSANTITSAKPNTWRLHFEANLKFEAHEGPRGRCCGPTRCTLALC